MEKIRLIKYGDLLDECGEPGSTVLMVKKKFPFPLKLNGDKNLMCYNFYGNKYIADSVIDAFQEILDIFGLDFVQKNNLDWYGGCFESRKSRGSDRISVHAWGMAVDYLPQLGRLSEPSLIPFHVVQAFKNRGFEWGGDWNRPDGMHFSGVVE